MPIAWIRKLLWVKLGDGMVIYENEGESGLDGRRTKLIKYF